MPRPSPTRILLVEDDSDLRDVLLTSLAHFGLSVRGVGNAAALDHAFAQEAADILLLDLNLPGENGYEIAARYRKDHPNVGIAMLTARSDRDSRVAGYGDGADLYFVKPVDHEELATALHNLARRSATAHPPRSAEITGSSWQLDLVHSRLVAPDGKSVFLTHNELCIVRTVADSAGDSVRREKIFAETGDPVDEYGAQRLETALSRLRAKLKQEGLPPLPIKARHKAGYAFAAPIQVHPIHPQA
jgi:DNA-binding response OmpR family regulator